MRIRRGFEFRRFLRRPGRVFARRLSFRNLLLPVLPLRLECSIRGLIMRICPLGLDGSRLLHYLTDEHLREPIDGRDHARRNGLG